MDYANTIECVYEHVESGDVDKATMGCLRIARHLEDYLYAAIFLRELYPDKQEVARALYDDIGHLKQETTKFLFDESLKHWLDVHTLDFTFGTNDNGETRNVLEIAVGEMNSELQQCERSIQDMVIPPGMGGYDIAAFTDRYNNLKVMMRLRMKAIQTIRERIKVRCLNYAIRIERQLETQCKTQNFLEQVQNYVNNYFKAHSEDVYTKLQKATQLVDSDNPEDLSLLLTQVRRAMKAAADFFYPPLNTMVRCADGNERILGDDQYLNRLQEFIVIRLERSSSRDLVRAEFDYLAVFARRLNDVASKGVHAAVSLSEAKQGLLGLYLFLHNICSRLDEKPTSQNPNG